MWCQGAHLCTLVDGLLNLYGSYTNIYYINMNSSFTWISKNFELLTQPQSMNQQPI